MADTLARGLELLAAQDPTLAAPRVDALLRRYLAELELFNPSLGLVGAVDRDEIVVKHLLDSLAPLPAIRAAVAGHTDRPLRIADAGSGAGLPGIPLAIALSDARFTLIERMGRRVKFLENTALVLPLPNVEIEQAEVEKAGPGRFDIVTFRAFRPLDAPMLKALFRLLAPGGLLAAYKARDEKIDEEMAAISGLVGSWERHATPVPFLDEPRQLVIVRP